MIIEKPRNEMNKSFGEAIPFFIKESLRSFNKMNLPYKNTKESSIKVHSRHG